MALVELPGTSMGKVQDILLNKTKRLWIAGPFGVVGFLDRCFGGGGERQRCGDDPLIRSADRLRSAVAVDRSGSTDGAAILSRVERAAGRESYDQLKPTRWR